MSRSTQRGSAGAEPDSLSGERVRPLASTDGPKRRGLLWRSERGAALVEFALVLPVLLLLVFGMMDFGKAINYWLDANHLAAEGARHVAVNRNLGTTLELYLRNQADTTELRNGGTGSVPTPLQTTLCYFDDEAPFGTIGEGDRVRVRATVTYRWMPFLGLSATTTTISGSAISRIEQTVTNHPPDC
jgi:Flp pilus assembly protein TadG